MKPIPETIRTYSLVFSSDPLSRYKYVVCIQSAPGAYSPSRCAIRWHPDATRPCGAPRARDT
eukprot:7273461-Prymnesium_polylepis.1